MKPLFAVALLPTLLAACATAASDTSATAPMPDATAGMASDALDAAIAGTARSSDNVVRDSWRHPKQTLAFFGVQPDQTVIEITPGGGWYTQILAPYPRDDGHYVAAIWDDAIPDQPKYRYRLNDQLRKMIADAPAVYGTPETRVFDPKAPNFGADGSADVVLTFRNAHNWVADGNAPAYFKAFYDVLKPGGTLGVVDHRAKPGTDLETMKQSGYLTQELVIGYATAAGFTLDQQSQVNANPRDNTDHVNGVWTLPPSNNHDKDDDAQYQAIGESDRMTLHFVKR
jgi:predicted methyltransferase